VVASILAQAGEPLRVWRGRAWRSHRGWSAPKWIAFEPRVSRAVYLFGAPDLTLFPKVFDAESVVFRAGVELGIMHRSLAMLSWLRGRGFLPRLTVFLNPVLWMSRWFARLGSDRGYMTVDVTGVAADGKSVVRRWQLTATDGDGPSVPAVAARAIIRKHAGITPGARPCTHDLTLEEIESAFSGLRVTTQITETFANPLFQRALQDTWHQLPAPVRQLHTVHDVSTFRGTAKVVRGSDLFARVIAAVLRFPEAGQAVDVCVTKFRTETGETWERNFNGRRFRSHLSKAPTPGRVFERFGFLTFEVGLPFAEGRLAFEVLGGWMLGLPLPRALMPGSDAFEYEEGGRFHFDVSLYTPLTRALIVRYQGSLQAMADGG
jgi:hypothetical protein